MIVLVQNSFSVGGVPAPYGTHLAWRVFTDLNGGSHRISLSGLQFQDGAGTPISTSGATIFEGGSGAANSPASNAFDGAPTTGNPWSRVSTGGTGAFVGAKFAAPVGVGFIRMWSANWGGSFDESPITGRLQYSDDTTTGIDGTWSDAFTFWEQSWYASGQNDRTHPQDTSGGKYKGFAWFPTQSNDSNAHMAIDEAELFTAGGSVDIVVPTNAHSFAHASVPVANAQALLDDVTTNWCELGAANRYAGICLPTPVLLTGYSLGKYQWLTEAWKNWTLKGTNDGATFSAALDTQVNQTWASASKKSYGPF